MRVGRRARATRRAFTGLLCPTWAALSIRPKSVSSPSHLLPSQLKSAQTDSANSSLRAQIELVKRCHRTEAGEHEVVGACLFPGLVKVWKKDGVAGDGTGGGEVQNVVRRAQVRLTFWHSDDVPRPKVGGG